MHDTDDLGSNPSTNPHLADMIKARLSRRTVLGGSLAAAAVGFVGANVVAPNPAKADLKDLLEKLRPGKKRPEIGFEEVPPSSEDEVIVPEGYVYDVLIPWGTPLFKNSPDFQEDASNSARDQELQVGFNHDGMHYFPLGIGLLGNRRGLLVLNHEYTDANQIYTAAQGAAITPDAAGKEKVAKALAGHGVTVVEIQQRGDGSWSHVVGSKCNRRVTGSTPMEFSGPRRARATPCSPPASRRVRSARSTTAPTASRPGAHTSPARKTGTATSAPHSPASRRARSKRATA